MASSEAFACVRNSGCGGGDETFAARLASPLNRPHCGAERKDIFLKGFWDSSSSDIIFVKEGRGCRWAFRVYT